MRTLFLLLLLLSPLFSCVSIDHQFTTFISVDFSASQLKSLCTEDTCSFSEEFIAIRSPSNPEVAIIFSLAEGRKGILFRLPYSISEDGSLYPSSIDPQSFEWATLVSSDLSALKRAGIISVSDEEIGSISLLSSSSKNIYKCSGYWKALEANCMCSSEGEVCVRCFGAPAVDVSLPSLPPSFLQTPQPMFLFAVAVLLVVLFATYLLLSKKR